MLLALTQNDRDVLILSKNRPPLTFEHDSYEVEVRGWLRLIQFRHLYAKHGVQKVKAVIVTVSAFFFNFIQILRMRVRCKNIPYFIVNGIASHSLYCRWMKKNEAQSIIVFREMPDYVIDRAKNFSQLCQQLDRYDRFVFVSRKSREEWSEYLTTEGKSAIIYNTISESEVELLVKQDKQAVRKNLGIGLDKYVVVCVGTLQSRKGQDFIVECLPELRQSIPNLRVLFAGKCQSKYRAEVDDMLRDNGCEDLVDFLGPRRDAMSLIYAADTLACPSRSEAFGRVVLEAMALKTPVVAADTNQK